VRGDVAFSILRVMAFHSARAGGPVASLRQLVASRGLLVELVKRDVGARYRASRIGLAWSLLSPLLQLLVFTFVFGTVLQTKWNRPASPGEPYALILFAGLVVFWLLNDCVARAPGLVRAHRQYVTRVVFPLEILPVMVVASACFHATLSIVVLLGAHVALVGALPWTALAVPVVLVPFLLLVLGTCWALAALGAYLPDLEQIIGVLLTATLFVSTIFFPAETAPPEFAPLLYLNPLSWIVDAFRGAVLWGTLPDPRLLGTAYAVGTAVALLGFAVFQKGRRGFADVV
jgi:lipopolysaccharide transport system permease protein